VALLVPLAIETGHLALADELLRRAILAVPYSEACAESAMELAAARGDLDGLTRAFEAMGRLAEELDPGSWPEPAAEDRFRTLRRRLLVGQASLAAMEAAPRNTRPSAPAAL
jgi:DNA-binding SARP family transcriptional activator